MQKRTLTSTVAALGLFALIGLASALAPSIASLNLARAHSGGATLTALTVTVDGTAQTLTPAFSSTVTDYTVAVANTVTQITITATPDGDGSVAYEDTSGTTLTDADPGTDGQQVDLPAGDDKPINVVVTHTDSGTTTMQTYGVLVSRAGTNDPCDGGGFNPTPTVVEVGAVPIVVESTTDEYFVLYVTFDVDGTEMELPVLVKKGAAGTTTLAENVEALPAERYSVEKYLIADPADVDGDCIGDITELDDLGNMSPVNSAPSLSFSDGAVSMPDLETYVEMSQLGDTEAHSKIVVLDPGSERPGLVFINAKTHETHQRFLDAMGIDRPSLSGFLTYNSQLVAPGGSRGAWYVWISSHITFATTERIYALMAANMPALRDDLYIYVPAYKEDEFEHEREQYEASRVDVVFWEDLSPRTRVDFLNPGVGFGRLRVMDPDDRPHPREVVIYETVPNELPRVAGVITTVRQTPLSHVNLRAAQDGVPNAYVRDLLKDPDVAALVGGFVRYEVTATEWSLRAATPREVDEHYESSRPPQAQTPQRDLSVRSITPLSDVRFEDWDTFGVKAANVAELGRLGFPEGAVPDGFAIPFYFYDEFMKANGFHDRIEQILADPDFQSDFDVQDDMLDDLRDDIEDAESPQWIIDALTEMHESFPEGTSLRYRSSTNNEDLPGFNGAGLYDSKTQDPEETEEDGIDKSLKGVFASLWNFRAFTERDFHRIGHGAAAMGVLVHPNYSDELANGVAVSFDPFYDGPGRYYVNTQLGEDLVTNPLPHSVPEELLLLPDGNYLVRSTSNLVGRGELLMSDAQIGHLAQHLTTIHDHFDGLYDPGPDEPFAMEIEFKITSDNVLAIKQARPWVFGSAGTVTLSTMNQAPVFRDGASTTRSVTETTTAGRNIGAPVTATDPDNDALTYSLGGSNADSFDIVASSGQLQTKSALVNATRNSYSVTVSVHDGKNDDDDPDTAIDATTRVTINVTTTTTTTRSGGGRSGGGRSRSRATPTPTPTPSPTPTPTGPQFSGVIAAEPSVTATVVPEGTTLGLNGGGDLPGGVYVNFPPTAVALPVQVSVSVSNEAPDDVTAPSGTTLLPLTIDITPETPLTLGTPLTIEINPTPEQLEAAGGDLNNLAVGVVTPHGIVVLPTQVMHGRLVVTTNRLAPFVLVAITDPRPVLRQPPMGDASSMGPLLQWTQPPETTWFQVQVIPFNKDGPGINLVIGDGALVRAAQYQVMAPNFGSADPNYVLLPDMTYRWRVRTSTVLTNPTEDDWSAWAMSSFKTPPASSSTITRVAPPLFGEVSTLTPTLTWANSNAAVFYYEVQVSRDYEFGPNAFLYSEYVHGGASTPPNSYVVPKAFPLEAGAIYYWRVRPRIQGDGDPLPWSRINVFQTPG